MTVFEDLVVKNAVDVENARSGLISPEKVRKTTVHFKVDTGAHRNLLTKEVCDALGLVSVDEEIFTLAGGIRQVFPVSSPIQIWWKNKRKAYMDAIIAPKGKTNLLSITALESMGLKVDPMNACLEPAFEGDIVGAIE